MRKKLNIRRNDLVQIVAGEDKGKRGRILAAMPSENKIVVEGVNMVWKHVRPSRQYPRGGRIEREAPIQVSNVMLLCQNSECKRYDKPVRVRRQAGADGAKARVCVKCSKPIVAAE